MMRSYFRLRQICILAVAASAVFGVASYATAQEKYTPTAENLKARAWFQDAKFGLFIHWGVYSVLGDGEWVMETRPITGADYEKLPSFFNPTKFNPAAWVALAKAAGMKYITITSKHHDGFAMFDSKLTDWNVVARTPYGKDVIGMLAAECHKQASNCSCITRNWTGIRKTIFRAARWGTGRGGPILETGMRT